MKIAFFGSSLVSAYWNGAATYYRGIIRALNSLGHDITFYEPDAYGRQQHRDMADPEWAKVVVYAAEGTDGVYKTLDAARNADLIVKASGVGVFDELLERAVLDARRPGAMAVFWDVAAPATLDRVQSDPADPFRALVCHVESRIGSGFFAGHHGKLGATVHVAQLFGRDVVFGSEVLDLAADAHLEPARVE